MKKNLLKFLIFSFIFLSSCASKPNVNEELNFLPEIINPTYQSYAVDGERGYNILFGLSDNTLIPVAVVFNKIKKPISETEVTPYIYEINVIAQTSLISNYKIQSTDLPNGILFDYEGKLYLKKVEFLKQIND